MFFSFSKVFALSSNRGKLTGLATPVNGYLCRSGRQYRFKSKPAAGGERTPRPYAAYNNELYHTYASYSCQNIRIF